MVANNLVEIYTLIFAWNMYGAIWDVIAGTGLALIPVLVLIIVSFKEGYEYELSVKETIAYLEVRLITLILVLMFCVIPYQGWKSDLASVRYDVAVNSCQVAENPPKNLAEAGMDDSIFNGTGGGLEVYKPIMWTFVSHVSTALTNTTIKSMQCVNDHDILLTQMSGIKIQQPDLRKRVSEFHEVCYKAAYNAFQKDPVSLTAETSMTEDVNWIGSTILLETPGKYYQDPSLYMSNMEKHGFSRDVDDRPTDAMHEQGAHPSCKEVWEGEEGWFGTGFRGADGLRSLILADLKSIEVLGTRLPNAVGEAVGISQNKGEKVFNSFLEWGYKSLTKKDLTSKEKEDLFINVALRSDTADLTSHKDLEVSGVLEVDKPFLADYAEKIGLVAGLITGLPEFLKASSINTIMKTVGPIIIALIQMLIIFSAPIVMTLSNYRFSTFTALGVSYFGFEFINAIFAVAYWFVANLGMYMRHDTGISDTASMATVQVVSIFASIFLPVIWLAILGYAGSGMVRGMGAMGVGQGLPIGSGSFSKIPTKGKK